MIVQNKDDYINHYIAEYEFKDLHDLVERLLIWNSNIQILISPYVVKELQKMALIMKTTRPKGNYHKLSRGEECYYFNVSHKFINLNTISTGLYMVTYYKSPTIEYVESDHPAIERVAYIWEDDLFYKKSPT